jgi:hypothetical protein
MVAKNDITGDSIQTKASSKAFSEGIDRIFDKAKEREQKEKEKAEYFAKLASETKAKMNQQEFDLESLDPDERSWYYDDYGVKRKKTK